MSGGNLNKISKTTLTVTNKQITNFQFELIDLNNANLTKDTTLSNAIDNYYNNPEFYVEIGSALFTLDRNSTGCFYTDALQQISGSDIVIQNFGGIRDRIKKGIITPFEIYSIDPFGNGFDTFTMSVPEFKNFLNNYPDSFSYSLDSNFSVQKNQNNEFIFFKNGIQLKDTDQITMSLNDYLSNVFPDYFPASPSFTFPLTTADYIIKHLTDNVTSPIDYAKCVRRNSTLNTKEFVETSFVKIFPSHIEFNPIGNGFSAEIYAITGQLVHKSSNSNKIDTQFLASGIYVLKLNLANKTQFKIQKFVK